MASPRTSCTTAEQYRLLLIQFESTALHRKLQNLQGRAFQVEKLATNLAHQMHFRLAATRTSVAVLQFVIFGSANNLNHPGLLQPGQVPVDGT